MKFKKVIGIILYLTLIFLSVEILVRRHLFAQIPTQIPGYAVYMVLTINLLLVLYWGSGYLKARVHKTMQDKN
jgi:hypothetical protein